MTINVAGVPVPGTYTLATYSSFKPAGTSAFALGTTSLNSRETQSLVVTSTAIDWVIAGYSSDLDRGNSGQWVGGNNWKRIKRRTDHFLPGDIVVSTIRWAPSAAARPL